MSEVGVSGTSEALVVTSGGMGTYGDVANVKCSGQGGNERVGPNEERAVRAVRRMSGE